MNSEISNAIIIRAREFGESDLLVWFFTINRGCMKGVAKGARRSKKRFLNCLDLFCLTRMEYEPKARGDLHLLHSCRLEKSFSNLRNDFYVLSLASYMVELTEVLFPIGVVCKEMFILLKDSLNELDKGGDMGSIRILFEGRAMALGGYGINLERCCRCGRPYEGKGDAVFIRAKGGISCLRCVKTSPPTPLLGPEGVEVLRAAQSNFMGSEPLTFTVSGEAAVQVRAVMKQHIEYQLGKRPRSADYLE